MVPLVIGLHTLFRLPFRHLVLVIVGDADALVVLVGKRILGIGLSQISSSVSSYSSWRFEISRARWLGLVD